MSKQTNCPQSPLSGFTPKPETVQDWMDKLTANGITEGVLCRLIHGRDEGKIVKFENYGINDLGVYTEGGYFLHSDKVIKVAKPLFVPLLELTSEVRFFGSTLGGEKFMYTHLIHGCYIELCEDGECIDSEFTKRDFWKAQGAFIPTDFYQFQTAQDLFAWMALND